jgi:NADH-quinone oxidoreductase subunit L
MLQFEAEVEGHSSIPLMTSLVVSLGGLLIGWLLYRSVKKADQPDPLQWGLGPVFGLLRNKYWIDEFYQLVFIKPALWFAENVSYLFLDKKLIDGVIHAIGKAGLWFGSVLRNAFDLPVINGAGDGLAEGTKSSGRLFNRLQNGKIQHYMGLAVLFLVITGIIVIYYAVAF